MIGRQESATTRTIAMGDAAVDGLFCGLAAGLVMGAYLVLAGLLAGEAPGVTLSRFSVSGPVSPLTGLLTHLAVSAVYGMTFGVLVRLLARPLLDFGRWQPAGWLAGLLYGAGLYGVARLVILPGTGSLLLEILPVHFVIAHLLFGLLLGFFFYRPTNG